MSVLLDRTSICVENPSSIISFETKGDGQAKIWDRYLCLEGKPAYHIGNICGTCEFFFERQEGANRKVSPERVSSALRAGIQTLNPELIQDIASILPSATYEVALFECRPQLVNPGENADYFSNEQIGLWIRDGPWDLPHHPQTEYYRTGSQFLGKCLPVRENLPPPNAGGSQLFEFCVPLYPKNRLNMETVESYRERLRSGEGATAVALSILDVKQPADYSDELEVNEHWCVAHYLLDGHHKTYAAAAVHKPTTLISFMDVSKGISTKEDAEYLLNALAR